MPPFEKEDVFCFAHVGPLVGWSVAQELIAQGSFNLVWWLVMTSR